LSFTVLLSYFSVRIILIMQFREKTIVSILWATLCDELFVFPTIRKPLDL
jgi:hypothetical protein